MENHKPVSFLSVRLKFKAVAGQFFCSKVLRWICFLLISTFQNLFMRSRTEMKLQTLDNSALQKPVVVGWVVQMLCCGAPGWASYQCQAEAHLIAKCGENHRQRQPSAPRVPEQAECKASFSGDEFGMVSSNSLEPLQALILEYLFTPYSSNEVGLFGLYPLAVI